MKYNKPCLLNCRNYCPALNEQTYIFPRIKTCLEQKEFKQYSALVEADKTDYDFDPPETAENYFGAKWNLQFMIICPLPTNAIYLKKL